MVLSKSIQKSSFSWSEPFWQSSQVEQNLRVSCAHSCSWTTLSKDIPIVRSTKLGYTQALKNTKS